MKIYATLPAILVMTLVATCTQSATVSENPPRVEKRVMEVAVNKEFSVEVFENATTGYQWFWLVNDAKGPIKLLRKEMEKPTEKTKTAAAPLVGAGHNVKWIFKAGKTGTHPIHLVYKRAWEASIGDYLDVEVTAH